MALFVGLIFMLVLTIIGLTAVRFSTQQSRMAQSMQMLTGTFQAAEAGIRGIVCEMRALVSCPPTGGVNILVDAIDVATPDPERTFNVGTGFTSSATVTYNGQGPAPGFSMGVGEGAMVAYRFGISATSTHDASGSQAAHLQGVQRVGPGL
jgi:Tfp pilus assembly protein PilX